MNIAQQIKKQIEIYYKDAYINYADLCCHIQDNRIDNFEPTKKHIGYERPYNDIYPVVFYYEDNSILIVSGINIITAKKD